MPTPTTMDDDGLVPWHAVHTSKYHRANPSGRYIDVSSTVCYRCGVTFDAAGILPGYPCRDCQEVEGDIQPDIWAVNSAHLTDKIREARMAAVDYHTTRNHSIRDTAQALGISARTVVRWRAASKATGNNRRYTAGKRQRAVSGEFKLPPERIKFILQSRAEGMSYYKLRTDHGHDIRTVKALEEQHAKAATNTSTPV